MSDSSPIRNKLLAKVQHWVKTIVMLVLNPRFLLCFGIGWIITNGWAYIAVALGTYFGIGWLTAVAGGYLALLWVPFTPEKIITAGIAIALLRVLFPNDEKTLGMLRKILAAAKQQWRDFLDRRKKGKTQQNSNS